MQTNNGLTIAVVLVTYNQQDFIIEALEGIRNQSRIPDQVIIADDASSDKTQKIIKKYVEDHGMQQSWQLLFSETNRGINENLNNAINNVKCEIIVPMAGDDISLPNRCELAEKLFIRHPSINIINTNGYIINEAGDIIGATSRPEGLVTRVEEAIRNGFPPISPVGECWRFSLFGQMGVLPPDIPNEDDQISFFGLLNGGILCDCSKTFKYRIHNQSASSWLRNKQSNKEFMTRFIHDMEIRRKHMSYWMVQLSRARPDNYERLKDLLEKKIVFYKLMSTLGSGNYGTRIKFYLKESASLPFREKFYCIFGKFGIIFWRLMRKILRRS